MAHWRGFSRASRKGLSQRDGPDFADPLHLAYGDNSQPSGEKVPRGESGMHDSQRSRIIDQTAKASIGLLATTVLGLWGWRVLAEATVLQIGSTTEQQEEATEPAWDAALLPLNPLADSAPDHRPLRAKLDEAGLVQPSLATYLEAGLPDETSIIGVSFEGQHHGFVLHAMDCSRFPIVNFLFHSKPLSVVCCSNSDRVRLLVSERHAWPLPLRKGGIDDRGQLVLKFGQQRFDLASTALPLSDHPFERTTVGAWHKRHPTSDFFIGKRPEDEFQSATYFQRLQASHPVASKPAGAAFADSDFPVVSRAAEATVIQLRMLISRLTID